jgi:hypothetical protein
MKKTFITAQVEHLAYINNVNKNFDGNHGENGTDQPIKTLVISLRIILSACFGCVLRL